ncbi:DUF6602 domain-containing protein [Desulfotignum balticum]|uniref:DUF6602 domain-containing protein n=1 Tax=Desulfotignum balticum TaxID=115781 RepID=UPI00040F034A|nr:DUF6602 domain-containing protein [Desulfotignum balticum]
MSSSPHPSRLQGEEFLQTAFQREQEKLFVNLHSSDPIVHNGDRGEVNEEHFADAFRHYLPARYTVEKAAILDSEGNTSDSIDLVVFDRQYTPTLLDSDKHRYVPAEAVYAVFECKPTVNKDYLEYAADKAASVRRLKRTSVPIQHAGGTYPAKKHFDIIAGLLALDIGWRDGFGDAFRATHQTLEEERRIDSGLAVSGHAFDVFQGGYAYSLCEGNNALVFFLFRLLNKLQSLGTVPAIDWNAYAERLSRTRQKED